MLIQGYYFIASKVAQSLHGHVIEKLALGINGYGYPMHPWCVFVNIREENVANGPVYVIALIIIIACYG
jgi:hypothetical protein